MQPDLSPPPASLDGFPALSLPAGARLWFVHPAGRWPWICSNDGSGRFDLSGAHGTSHLAAEPLGALIECCCRHVPEVDGDKVRGHRLSVMRTERPLRLADFADPRAFGFGITAEVHSIPDYTLTQRWAAALHAAGFDGVRYLLRHDPSRGLEGVARFGPEGERRDWPSPSTEPVPQELLEEAARRLGVRVTSSARAEAT